ncbi:urease accessory protein UreD [Cohnella yongneupensis]|uniref:Urease accessory protein UreD n=1 Tax=Cohnella yongneupensis TaxID=425006 RepID=A0ABW0R847_9BACL
MRRLSSAAEAEEVSVLRPAELCVVAGLVYGRPELISRYHTSPLKIAKTFQLDGNGTKQLAVVQMDGSPGLLEGDRYRFDWRVQENVRVYATNQAYTRVHPCGEGESRLTQRLALERNAVLEWMPEPVMLFKDARFASETEIDLAAGAICMASDIFSPGRLSRGESFAFRTYDNRVTVRYNGELVHYQRQRWEPSHMPLRSAGCFGDATHIGSFSIFSDRVNASTAASLREWLNAAPALAEGVSWGISHTARYGVVLQAAGGAAWRLERIIRAAWDGARKLLLDEPPLRLLRNK